jgi:hypothetical protein
MSRRAGGGAGIGAPPKRACRRDVYDCGVGNPFARIGKFSAKTASTPRKIELAKKPGKRDRRLPVALLARSKYANSPQSRQIRSER